MKKNNTINEILEEAMDAGGTIFGGAGGGGSGTFSYVQQAGAKTWAPRSPKGRASTGDPQGYNVKDIGDDEAMFNHKAPKKRPFPLDTINDFLVDAYIQMCNAEAQLKYCKKYNAIFDANKEKKVLLDHLHKKSTAMKTMIKTMSTDLDKLSFS